MGSPPEEQGRFDNETLHQVTLTEGYWLAETPCTQALWTAVMKDNPSEFKSPDRPVENVSFEAVQAFLQRIRSERTQRWQTRAADRSAMGVRVSSGHDFPLLMRVISSLRGSAMHPSSMLSLGSEATAVSTSIWMRAGTAVSGKRNCTRTRKRGLDPCALERQIHGGWSTC